MKKERNKSITRRDFIKKSGVAGAALGTAAVLPSFARKAFAAKRDYILIGHPNPSTGPLAGFGESSPWTDNRAIDIINKQGGIFIKELGKKVPIKQKLVDTESNPTKAAELASKLILQDKVDIMLALHTPDTVNPVDAICERYEVPCISLDAPIEPWLSGGPYKWSFHAFWTVDAITDLFIGMWDQYAGKTNKVVGGIWPNDADGTSFSEIFAKKLPERGYRLVDPGRFPYFNKDFSSLINTFKKEKVEIIQATVIPPDWVTAWKQFHQQGFIPKIATVAKAALFPKDVEALGGNLPDGLTKEIWWSPHHPFNSSLTGETAKDLCAAWEKETDKQWTPPIGYKYAGFEIAVDALKRAGTLDKNKIREAIAKTDMNTIVGPIKYNEKNYCETPLVGGQWVKGKKWPWEQEITYNKSYPGIKKTAEMQFPLSK